MNSFSLISLCPTCAMASEAKAYTVGCVFRVYHVYNDAWSSYIGEVLYCRGNERSAELVIKGLLDQALQ